LALVLRGRKFFSIPEAADRVGVTRLTVYRWISGTRSSPDGAHFRDVIRDTRSRQIYLPEEAVRRLRAVLRKAQRAAKRQRARD
jgi:transposase